MAKKAELELEARQYHALMERARAAQRRGLYQEAIDAAFASLDFVDGMMQYERRFESRTFDSVDGIDLILEWAPLVLGYDYLDRLESLLKEKKRIQKHTSEDLGARLAEARELMWAAYRVWEFLEHHAELNARTAREVLKVDSGAWQAIRSGWLKMRIADDSRKRGIALATRLGKIVDAKCPACGLVAEAPKAMFLEELACPKCKKNAWFVLV